MDISFVILAWNSERYIAGCISSIINNLFESQYEFEILIVDNGSADGTVQLIRGFESEYPRIIVPSFLRNNKGTTVSRNIALKKARGNFICVMDSDVEVTTDVFTELITTLNNDQKIGIAVPKIIYPSGNWQKSYDQFPTLVHKINRFFRLRAIEGKEAESNQCISDSMNIDYAISAFWLFKRTIINKVGFLDERIFYSPEDVDYCLRVWKAGYRIVYVPTVTVVHYTQEISRGWKLNKSKISHLKGLFYLFIKHGYFFKKPFFASEKF